MHSLSPPWMREQYAKSAARLLGSAVATISSMLKPTKRKDSPDFRPASTGSERGPSLTNRLWLLVSKLTMGVSPITQRPSFNRILPFGGFAARVRSVLDSGDRELS